MYGKTTGNLTLLICGYSNPTNKFGMIRMHGTTRSFHTYDHLEYHQIFFKKGIDNVNRIEYISTIAADNPPQTGAYHENLDHQHP